MERSTTDKTQHQAAFSSWIVRILFQQFSILDDRRLDLYEIQILFEPFLLGMKADFVLPISKQPLDLV
jgi:hypothetical protein